MGPHHAHKYTKFCKDPPMYANLTPKRLRMDLSKIMLMSLDCVVNLQPDTQSRPAPEKFYVTLEVSHAENIEN